MVHSRNGARRRNERFFVCENKKHIRYGAASGGMFFVGSAKAGVVGQRAILHNIVIGHKPVVVGFLSVWTITHIM